MQATAFVPATGATAAGTVPHEGIVAADPAVLPLGSRIRVTADGKLRTCLFSKDDHDLKFLLRGGSTDEDIAEEIRSIVVQKEKGHRINDPDFVPPSRTMVFIGG